MKRKAINLAAIRQGIASIPADVSNDAVGAYTPKLRDIYAPETHAAALDPTIPVVLGSRGAGKSFWSGVLGQDQTREAAATAYPRLGLQNVLVEFGFTGVGGEQGVTVDAINEVVPMITPTAEQAKSFWWATVLKAAESALNQNVSPLDMIEIASNWKKREQALNGYERSFRNAGKTLLVVYDALDTVATTWPRRRLLTEALLEVVWAMRAYSMLRVKLFVRPDQVNDDALRFVELPKLRTGAVRLTWSQTDLYGLLFSRLALAPDPETSTAFRQLLEKLKLPEGDRQSVLTRKWSLSFRPDDQAYLMEALAGKYMSDTGQGFKKGKTYDWPAKHLADAFNEVTPRSFLGLMIAAAQTRTSEERVITPDGIRHGLRAASKTRVDQLHQEFPWIKGVLAPLAGLLLPQEEKQVIRAWKRANTLNQLLTDASKNGYLPPFPAEDNHGESDLLVAMMRIGVMSRRKDDRVDMPDLFRVAAKLLKKGATAPL